MEKKLNTLERGATFTLAGIEWLVLGVQPKAYPNSNDHYFVEATRDLFQAPFDEDGNNNWNNASLRERLNGPFLDELVEECPALADAIVPLYRDLTADDGLKDYGSCLDKVTILTADEYRQTRDLHPAQGGWRWLITPDGTPASSGTAFVRDVISDGSLSLSDAYRGYGGVRPALLLCGDDEDAKAEVTLSPEQKEMALYEAAVEKFGEAGRHISAKTFLMEGCRRIDDNEVFTIPARRCKRCGGLLTSAQAINDGYGHTCKMKARREALAREEAKNQMSLFAVEDQEDSKKHGNGKCTTGLSPTGHCGAAVYCPEPFDCCAACSKGCNIRCGWAPERTDHEKT